MKKILWLSSRKFVMCRQNCSTLCRHTMQIQKKFVPFHFLIINFFILFFLLFFFVFSFSFFFFLFSFFFFLSFFFFFLFPLFLFLFFFALLTVRLYRQSCFLALSRAPTPRNNSMVGFYLSL